MCFRHRLVVNCCQELSPLQAHAVSGDECVHAYCSYIAISFLKALDG